MATARHGRLRRRAQQALITGLVGALVALAAWLPGWLDSWEAKTWDARVRMLARPVPQSNQIRVILLDQASLDWGEQSNGWSWPWPREVYSAIVSFCHRGGAKALAFDVLFSEPSLYGVGDDAGLASAITEFGPYAQAMTLGDSEQGQSRWPEDIPEPNFQVRGLDSWFGAMDSRAVVFGNGAFPVEDIGRSALVLSNVSQDPDPDGVFRRIRLLSVFDGQVLPSLGLGAYLAAHPTAGMEITDAGLVLDGELLPLDSSGRATLAYRGPSRTHGGVSAKDVIRSEIQIRSGQEPDLSPLWCQDAYVFFGFSAPGLLDLRAAPVQGVYPGVEIHATTLDNILARDFFRFTPQWAVVMLVLAAGLLGGGVVTLARSALKSALALPLLVLLPGGLGVGAYTLGYWTPVIAPTLAGTLAGVLAMTASYAGEGRQRRFLKQAFSQYLSPAVIEELILNPDRLRLGGERRELSIFFSDLEGFTAISEHMEPEALTSLLNDYLSAMTDIILDQGGTVDKYEGDAIIAFWNAPLDQPDHAVRAVRAALLCQQRLAELGPEFEERAGRPVRMRIGINTGPAIVGNLGSDTRFDYSMLGDSVNLAARLEGANKQFTTYTMISEAAEQAAKGAFSCRELGRISVVGRREPVRVFEPFLDEEYSEKQEVLEQFGQGLEAYTQGNFSQAHEIFEAIKDVDGPAAVYALRCKELAEEDSEYAGGVIALRKK